MNQTVIFWKPELLIRAEASGLYVAVKAAAPSTTTAKPAEKPRQALQYVS